MPLQRKARMWTTSGSAASNRGKSSVRVRMMQKLSAQVKNEAKILKPS